MADKTFTIERSIDINAPAETVYRLIADLRNWKQWSPWDKLDPDMDTEYAGAESGVGAKYSWSGNRKAGKGSMEIVEATEPSNVSIKLDFVKPMKSTNSTTFAIAEAGDTSTVTWTMVGPRTIFSLFAKLFGGMDKMIGKDFEKGLADMKAAAEAK
ncbi:SRPBCC family protein [Hoyosella rhizosphaerae]|uniref:Polyketide cyclase n=1 Tax=Hoyosella rhizosphaerae TaxID=1755582 RepID=A0A916XAU2_9ACTN|nr:SRPBCC family protein [Hoyosella rhizosphaerae]MBN4926569.1 SRPBCC family protein [Hoyosella rhizosphaerae]GGC58213.1 polyketide cyclase [Hoyosella rhizosphaerae]